MHDYEIKLINDGKEKAIWIDNLVVHYLKFIRSNGNILVDPKKNIFWLYDSNTNTWNKRTYNQRQGGITIMHELYKFVKLNGLFENRFTNVSRLQQEVMKLEAELISDNEVAPNYADNRYHNFIDGIFDIHKMTMIKHSRKIFTDYQHSFKLKWDKSYEEALLNMHKNKSYTDFFSEKSYLSKLLKGSLEFNPELMMMVAQMFGTAVSKERYPVMYILTGLQGTSKSTILKLLSLLIGKQRCSTVPLEWFAGTGNKSDKFASSSIIDNIVNISEEIKGETLDAEIVKTIIAENNITIRRMHQEPTDVSINTRFFGVSNNALKFDSYEGIERRFKYIKLTRQIPEEEIDLQIINKINNNNDDLRKVFLFAISGVILIKKGMNEFKWLDRFYQSQDSVDEKNFVMETTRPSHAFLNDIEFGPTTAKKDGEGFERMALFSKPLWGAFKNWAEENGHLGSARISLIEFKKQVAEFLRYRFKFTDRQVKKIATVVGRREKQRNGWKGTTANWDLLEICVDKFDYPNQDDVMNI